MKPETLDKLHEILATEFCVICGSQRCDGSPEWLSGCPHWNRLIEAVDVNE